MLNRELIKRVLKQDFEFYNSKDFSRYQIVVDVRNPEYAVIACETFRSPKRQYIVVERKFTNLRDYRCGIGLSKLHFGVNLDDLLGLDFEESCQSSCKFIIVGKGDLKYPYLGTGGCSAFRQFKYLIEFCSLINSEEILDKLVKTGLTFHSTWFELVSDSKATSLKKIFGNERFRACQKISKILKLNRLDSYDLMNSRDNMYRAFEVLDSKEFFDIAYGVAQDRRSEAISDFFTYIRRVLDFEFTSFTRSQAMIVAKAFMDRKLDYGVWQSLKDYWAMCARIKDFYDTSKLPVIPGNLESDYDTCKKLIEAKHDFVTDIFNKHADALKAVELKDKQEDYEKKVYPKAKALEWENNEYVIFAPTHLVELLKEGRELKHCVGSYTTSVAKGEEYILFFRKKSERDTPFFTVDVTKDLKVRQIHGRRNCNVPVHLTDVFKAWADAVKVNMQNTNGIYCPITYA